MYIADVLQGYDFHPISRSWYILIIFLFQHSVGNLCICLHLVRSSSSLLHRRPVTYVQRPNHVRTCVCAKLLACEGVLEEWAYVHVANGSGTSLSH